MGKIADVEYQRLGRTDIEVSKICLGTWQMSGDWGAEQEGPLAAVRTAFDSGVTFFDTAYAYGLGAAERALARGLGDLAKSSREELVIATKGGLEFPGGLTNGEPVYRNSDPTFLRETLEISLRSLGMDYVDVYFVHWPDPTVAFEETAATIAGFVEEGLVRHAGVSNFSVAQMDAFSARGEIGVAQLPYSVLDRRAGEALIPHCAEHEIGIMGWSALASGVLSGALRRGQVFAADDWRSQHDLFKGGAFEATMDAVEALTRIAAEHQCSLPQLALAWVLANPAGIVPIVGAQLPEHIEDSVKAVEIELAADVVAQIAEIAAAVPTFQIVGKESDLRVRTT